MMIDRADRQIETSEWVERTFGKEHLKNSYTRIKRFMEEALELAQACGMNPDDINKIIAHVYERPPGDPGQEMGGVQLTLLALATSLSLNADHEEEKELKRVLSLPPEHFQQRNKAKTY